MRINNKWISMANVQSAEIGTVASKKYISYSPNSASYLYSNLINIKYKDTTPSECLRFENYENKEKLDEDIEEAFERITEYLDKLEWEKETKKVNTDTEENE